MKKENVVAIIPARGGSKGLKLKNIQKLHNKTLLEWNIELLKKISLIDRIIVSTDSLEIQKIAQDVGAEAPFLRPPSLSCDYSTTEDTLIHAILWLKENENYDVDIVVFQQVNDLFKRKSWIEECILALLNTSSLDTAFVAEKVYKNYWIEENGKFQKLTNFGHIARQLKKPIYREDTGIACATRAKVLLSTKRRIGDNVLIIPYEEEITIDIHSEFDLELARLVVEKFEHYRNLLEHG